MSLVQPDMASQLSQPPSSEPALPKTSRAKQDNTTSRAKAPSTWMAKGKGKGNPAIMTDGDDDVATQPVSKSRSVTPVEDPGCQSPIWGAQVPRLATSSFEAEDLSKPAPPKTTCSKAPSTWSAKAKASRPAMTDDGNVATQPELKSCSVSPLSDSDQDLVGKAASPSGDSGCDDESAESHSHLQALQRDELLLWVEEHQIESQGKRPTRRDLINVIAGAPKLEQPSKEDIESIVKEVTQIKVHRKGCIAASYLTRALVKQSGLQSSISSESACSQASRLAVNKSRQFKVKKIGPQSTKSQLKVIIDFN
ncbi:hypothetical protein EDB85DRAFT_1897226 [Lactarius pseudohatsudake]|nr:hypothetical protein EDB85DRAFT_1897226 [Lactarius pseudohatsudake]